MTADGPRYDLASARAAADDDHLADWVADFLASPGSDNADLADILDDKVSVWAGPMELPIDELHRLAGPEDAPALVTVEDDEWRDGVYDMRDKVEEGWEPPPVIVTWQPPQLVLEDGNHRVESLRQAGEDRAWAIVGFADERAHDAFVAERERRSTAPIPS